MTCRLLAAVCVLFAALAGLAARAQRPGPDAVPAAPIQDNSFLVEEAYNQEAGVVQHISSLTRSWTTRDLVYTFTQEWPAPHRWRHQLSYTLAAARPGAFADAGAGFGDLLLNYRYQLVGDGEARLAVAPRASLLVPTGNARLGQGAGGWGMQTNLPLSVVLTKRWVTHWNAGATFVPHATAPNGERAATHAFSLGQSVVWLAEPRLNFLVETVWTRAEVVTRQGVTRPQQSLLLNPGIRCAYNFASGLQIVPGIGIPVGVGPSRGEKGVFLYLSFEHPLHPGRSK